MSGAFGVDGGHLTIEKDGRVVFTTAGHLLAFLTTQQTYSPAVVFPDVPKGELYGVQFDIDYTALGGMYGYTVGNAAIVGALPQSWSNTQVIAAAPAGANLFIGRVALSRTVNPSHAWGATPLTPVIPTGVELGLMGATSFLLEQAEGFARALSIYISGGNLIAHMQQSVGPVCGNFNDWGTSIQFQNDSLGGRNEAPSGAGIPVYQNTNSPYSRSEVGQTNTYSGPDIAPGVVQLVGRYYRGQSFAAVYADPTNYGATYALTIKGRFGRYDEP